MVLLVDEKINDGPKVDGLPQKPLLTRRLTVESFGDFESERTEWFIKSFQRFNSQPDLVVDLHSAEKYFFKELLPADGRVMVESPVGEKKAPRPYQEWVSDPPNPLIGSPSKSPRKKGAWKSAEDIQEAIRSKKIRELKNTVRENCWPLTDPIRSRLWQLLVSNHSTEKTNQSEVSESLYWDTVNQIFGTKSLPKNIQLPSMVDSRHLYSYHLNRTGVLVAKRVVSVLAYNFPDITYAPSIFPVCCLLLHYLSETETYLCLSVLVSSRTLRFFSQTKRHFEANWRTLMILSRKHAKSACAFLAKRLGDESKAEGIFQNWFWFIFRDLSFPYLVRILDNFLCEGRKALYRVWIALLVQFHKQFVAGSPSKTASVDEALGKFCKEIQWSPEKLLRHAYNIRGLKGADIERTFLKTEMYLKSRSISLTHPNFGRSMSSDAIPTSQIQQNVQQGSRTLTVRELLSLWSWLPVRITMYQPILLYTSEEHGCSLTTLFTRIEHYGPTIMIIKTCSGEVFGAYCSSPWSKRNEKDYHGNRQAYFGTGESFVFTLFPERRKYSWVGLDANKTQEDIKEKGTDLFMAADSHMLVIGGGKGQAIYLDADLRFGKTDTCLTFNNPPLCPSKDFEIQVIEVYGFAGYDSP